LPAIAGQGASFLLPAPHYQLYVQNCNMSLANEAVTGFERRAANGFFLQVHLKCRPVVHKTELGRMLKEQT
jgi:hypothetical protein